MPSHLRHGRQEGSHFHWAREEASSATEINSNPDTHGENIEVFREVEMMLVSILKSCAEPLLIWVRNLRRKNLLFPGWHNFVKDFLIMEDADIDKEILNTAILTAKAILHHNHVTNLQY